MFGLPLLILFVVVVSATSGDVPPDLRTRAERTGFDETSRYDDVRRVLEDLAAAQSRLVFLTRFGRSDEGRDLPLAVIGSPAPHDPASARATRKPRVLLLANIHAGEVEGKEAALMLARRLAGGDLRRLLERVTVLVAPIYNADGNERVSVNNRPAQFGPVGGVGTRETARGLDLNRDFIKLEAIESQGLASLLSTWDPHVVIDLHTTNGSYHGYHLTYAPTLAVNADPRLVQATRSLLTTAQQVLADRGWRSYSYGTFVAEGALDRELTRPGTGAPAWRTFDARPRFVTNGIGLRNRIAILSEAYSYLSFERRVRVTEAFTETVLALVARRAATVTALTADIDRATARAGDQGTLGALGTRGRLTPLDGAVRILVGEVETRPHPRTGTPMTVMKEGVARPMLMQDYAGFAPVDPVQAPRAYLVPGDGTHAALVETLSALLARHGVVVERLASSTALEVEVVTPGAITRSERVFQGHREVNLVDVRRSRRTVQAPAGSLRVSMGQPLARLIFHLLEPSSDDGVVTWNLVDEWLTAGAEVPIYRVMD
ncbi:MAG: M14 family metallopeptidase [Vicinamibacteria bacterium]|nr:M14 family metallopeptidase [Vicinamibacteria bacterium]